LTSEQLQNARAERWRQLSNPVMTAEDARAWLDRIGFCLFLPKCTSGLALVPAPSFVEAVLGVPSEAPGREAIENATALLHRLAADAAIVPLSLLGGNHFGATGAGATDTPDYLVTREALPYVFSLIGGRNWKSGPGGKASPLMVEVWTLLNEGAARTAQEIRTALGRELTEAAVLHALVELWNGLRVIPVYDGESATAARWELTQARFAAEMTASQKVAQVTALSALVSLYVQSVVAASSDEIETFLSPLAARSRMREVVNGLSATRQLELVSVGAQPLFHVAGSLPEFAEPAKAEARVEESHEVEPKAFERREPRAGEARATGKKQGDRPGGFKKRDRFDERPRFEGRPRFEKRTEGYERRPQGKKPLEKPEERFGGQTFEGKRSREGRERRADSGGGKFPPKRFGKSGERKPWQERGERRSFERPTGRGREGEFRPRRDERGERGERGDKWGDRRGASSREFERREPRGKRPFFGEGGAGGERGRDFRSGSDFRSGAGSRHGRWKPKGERVGFPKQSKPEFRKAGERGFERSGEREERDFRREGRPQFKSGSKPGFGKKKSGEDGAGKPGFKKGFGKSGKPFGKPGTGSGKPFGKSAKPFGKSGKPRFGKGKRGGFKPPFGKRKNDDGGKGE
jgi:23S rRNA pseudouridine2605 synthase